MTRALLLACALLLPTMAWAEGQVDVEVILFRHLDADPARLAGVREPASYEDLRPLEPEPVTSPGDDAAEPPREYPHWTVLPPSLLRLAPHAKTLSRAGPYEVLLHVGWRQPVNSRHRVRLQAGDPPTLDGALQVLGSGRKMQVQKDFTLLAGENAVRVQGLQQMRAGEFRYLDHALLGMLIQVSPVNSAVEPASSEPGPTAAPADAGGDVSLPAGDQPQPGPAD